MKTSTLFKGTLILTLSGIFTRLLGFYYRIFLTQFIGTEGLGLYQMVFPIIGLCMAISCSGLSMAISRFTAYYTGRKNELKARQSLLIGMILSFLFSMPCSLILFFFSNEIALFLLKDLRCAQLIRLLSLMLPLSVIHASITSYYIGKSNALIPAVSQIIEQCIRIAGVFILCKIQQKKGLPITALTGMAGLFCGEVCSSLFCLTVCSIKISDLWKEKCTPLAREMIHMSIPIGVNRVLLSSFHSVEAILIPLMLRRGGLTSAESLSLYGILSGMAVPLIMLPSTFINSFSSMLLPAVSKSSAKDHRMNSSLTRNITTAYQCSLYMGILCFGEFWVWGKDAGLFLFSEPLAGVYTRAFSWMCPFLYIGTTLSSILNGLGKTRSTLTLNIIALSIRILLIFVLIPRMGITGFFVAFLLSEMFFALCSAYRLHCIQPVSYSLLDWLLKPLLSLALATGASLYVDLLLKNLLPTLPCLLHLILNGSSMVLIYCILLYTLNGFNEKKAS